MSKKHQAQPTSAEGNQAKRSCSVCERPLPFCVRSDRRFCSSRCRVWAFRNPGRKRLQRPRRARPRNLDQALAALAEARKYAAKLEAIASVQTAEERQLLAELAAVRRKLNEA